MRARPALITLNIKLAKTLTLCEKSADPWGFAEQIFLNTIHMTQAKQPIMSKLKSSPADSKSCDTSSYLVCGCFPHRITKQKCCPTVLCHKTLQIKISTHFLACDVLCYKIIVQLQSNVMFMLWFIKYKCTSYPPRAHFFGEW